MSQDGTHVGTYGIKGRPEEQVRLCQEHLQQRKDAGQQIVVPVIDHVAYLHWQTGRTPPPRPCVDCTTNGGRTA